MTYPEAVFALRHLPANTAAEMHKAAREAEIYWGYSDIPKESIVVAKAAAVELVLIVRGALSVLQTMR